MLNAIGAGIWLADGPKIVAAAGFHYPTRMAVIRLAGGDILVWSPIAITDGLRAEIDGLGPVCHIVAPNSLHHMAVPDWAAAYPDAKVYAAPRLRAKRRDIAFSQDLTDEVPAAWAGHMDQVVMRGNLITAEVVFFHIPSGTALFADLLQQLPATWFSGWRKWVARLDLMTTPRPTVPRKFRVAFIGRTQARAALKHILAWPTRQVVVAHGTLVRDDGQAFLAQAFKWLSK